MASWVQGCPVLLQKGTLWFADKKRRLLCEPQGGGGGGGSVEVVSRGRQTCPLVSCCADQAARRFEPAAVAPSPAQPAVQTRRSGALHQRTIAALSPLPVPSSRLSQLLIKDVGGPSPGTQRACPLIKPQTRSDSGPAGGGDESISWLFRRPNSHGLGQKMGQREVMSVGPLQGPPPKGKDDNIVSPRRGRGASQMGGSGVASLRRVRCLRRQRTDLVAAPSQGPTPLQLRGSFLKSKQCPFPKIRVSSIPCLKF